jgi:hypothetical protein
MFIRVTRPSMIFPSLGSIVACVCCVVAESCLDIDRIGSPFLTDVVIVGPRMEACIMEDEDVEDMEGGWTCVPVPGVYADNEPNGCPGKAIFGTDISLLLEDVIAPLRGRTKKRPPFVDHFLLPGFETKSPALLRFFISG